MTTYGSTPEGFDVAFARVLATEPGAPERRAAASAVVDALARGRTLAKWGYAVHRQHDRRVATHSVADVTQTFALAILEALNALDAGNAAIRRPLAWLHGVASRAARGVAISGAVTPMAGMAGAAARRRRYAIARSQLSERLDREPTPREVVDHANAHAVATRKNPAKQGALLTLADASYPRAVDVHDKTLHVGATDGGLERVEMRVDVRIALARAVDAIERLADGPQQRELALRALGAWADIAADGEDPNRTVVARALGYKYPAQAVRDAYALVEHALAVARGDAEMPAPRDARVAPIHARADHQTEILEAA